MLSDEKSRADFTKFGLGDPDEMISQRKAFSLTFWETVHWTGTRCWSLRMWRCPCGSLLTSQQMSTSTTSSSGMPSNEILYPRKTHCWYLPNEIRNQEWVRRDSYQGCCDHVLFFLNVTVHLICVHQIQTKNLLLTQSSSIKLTQKPIAHIWEERSGV